MSVLEKLLLVTVVSFFNKSGDGDKDLSQRIVSINNLITDAKVRLSSLPRCEESMSHLMAPVYALGANPEYDSDFEKVMICVSETRHAFDELSQMIRNTADELNLIASEESTIPDVLSIPSLNLNIDLISIDDSPLVRVESKLKFLSSLRALFKRVRSSESIRADDSSILIHFKEGHDLQVFYTEEANEILLQSATLEPTYPCFQEAVKYALSRNDIGLLAQQAITGLYASKRLHREMDSLQDKATITTDDDVNFTIQFAEDAVIRCKLPELYPNNLGLVTIETIDGPKKEVVEKAIENKAFSQLSEVVKMVYRAIQEYPVFSNRGEKIPHLPAYIRLCNLFILFYLQIIAPFHHCMPCAIVF